jgi:hypothetical protein
VDMGNGQLAYALQEVVVTGVPFNKYGDKFFIPYYMELNNTLKQIANPSNYY